MPTICPNCLRPVRTDAKFCGYCGSNLTSVAHDDGPMALAAALESLEDMKDVPAVKPQTKPSGGKGRRTVLMAIIILLCLVLLIAFSFYYFRLIG